MKALFWLAAILLLAVGIALAAYHNTGYVVLLYAPYRIEMSLNLLLTALVAAFALLYALIRFAVNTLRLPAYVQRFKAERKREKGDRAMQQALLAEIAGRYARAEKFALSAMEFSTAPGLAALIAARAAHRLKANDRRDHYLLEAERLAPDEEVARLMLRAEFLLDERRTGEAMEPLRRVVELDARNSSAIRLELKAAQQRRDWTLVLALVAELEKRDAIEPLIAQHIKFQAHLEEVKHAATDVASLRAYWDKLSSKDRLDPKIAFVGARSFASLGEADAALEVLTKALEQQWDRELVKLYGEIFGREPLRQIERAEGWANRHPQDSTLLLTLGRLCTQQRLWGKAQSYLEASLSIEATREAHAALAELLDATGRPEEACRHLRASARATG